MAAWQLRTEDGLLDLTFRPEGLRREDKNLLVAASRYVQPIGVFSGWVTASANANAIANATATFPWPCPCPECSL